MKPVILAFVKYYLPGYKSGGPVRTIANMVDHLGDYFDFRIVTEDRDAGDTEAYSGIVVDEWNSVGHAQVYYISPGRRTLSHIARVMRSTAHDLLYLNSFFDEKFTLKPLLARRLSMAPRAPTVIAPRGEFSPGAFDLKRWKKVPYATALRVFGATRDLTWQASSEYEAQDIGHVMGAGAGQVVIAPDLPPPQTEPNAGAEWVPRASMEPLRICYLSRISPKKNLDYALEVLRDVSVPVVFDIYGGPSDEAYWQHCQRVAARLPVHVRVHWRGLVDHDDVPGVLARHDLFFLPTRGENYGHAIHEALTAGLPVLISDQTPWRDLEAYDIGWDLPLADRDRFRMAIEEQARLSVEAQRTRRSQACEFARTITLDDERVAQNRALFAALVS